MASTITLTIDVAPFRNRMTRHILDTSQRVDQVVLQTAVAVLADTVESWPVDSGESRAAWYGPRREAPATYRIGNPTPQAPIIEFGGWKNPGPLTHPFGGATLSGDLTINAGVYSNKAPEAPLRRALSANRQAFVRALRAAMSTPRRRA